MPARRIGNASSMIVPEMMTNGTANDTGHFLPRSTEIDLAGKRTISGV